MITAVQFEVKRWQEIEFVSITDTNNDNDEHRNLIFSEQSSIVYKCPLILFKINALLKMTN